MDMRTWAEIDLEVFRRNVRLIREQRPQHDLIAVLKADAYGHGAVPVAEAAVEAGAGMIGVGDSREALELQEAGIDIPVLILGAIIDGEMPAVVRGGFRTTIHSMDRVIVLDEEARRQGRIHHVHLKIDTGMGRLGLLPERALDVARRVAHSENLVLEGLSTHLANGKLGDRRKTGQQLAEFEAVYAEITGELGPIPIVHSLNTAAAFDREIEDRVGNAIRVGAALYGIPGTSLRPYPFDCAMTLKSQVIYLKDIPPGTSVGYNGTWEAPRKSRLAILPLGYNDGLPLSCSNQGHVMIRGQRAPIRGAVSMDYTTVDVTDIDGTAVGDEALIFGRAVVESNEGPPVMVERPLADLADCARTSAYALTCGVGKRVHRVYLNRRDTGRGNALPLEGSFGHP